MKTLRLSHPCHPSSIPCSPCPMIVTRDCVCGRSSVSATARVVHSCSFQMSNAQIRLCAVLCLARSLFCPVATLVAFLVMVVSAGAQIRVAQS